MLRVARALSAPCGWRPSRRVCVAVPLAPSSYRRLVTAAPIDSVERREDVRTETDDHDSSETKRETPAQKNAREFALLPELVRVFEANTGHRVVPYHVVIPKDGDGGSNKLAKNKYRLPGRVSDPREIPWPKEARGMNFGRVLGKFVTNAKHQKKHPRVVNKLRAMGFPFGDEYEDFRWEQQTMAPLRTFYKIHQHCLVPEGFEVPRGDLQWPVASWGDCLGARVARLRKNEHQLNAIKLADLVTVEFSFDVRETKWSEYILPSLEAYARKHGHCRVPQGFEVPRDATWPRKAWGLPLGVTVSVIRGKGYYAKQVERDQQCLESIGFVWDHDEYVWTEMVLSSLKVFHHLNSHSRVPKSFVVPSAAPWPEVAWGYKLGNTVDSMRSKGYFSAQVKRDAAELEALDFVWDVSDHKWRTVILPAMQVFHHLNSHSRVPKSFVVPSTAPWPEVAWGLKLGNTVDSIRSKGYFSAQAKRDAAELEALDFVWDVSDHKWRTVILPALEAFSKASGHCDVPRAFVVPSEVSWPKEAWGLKLGVSVYNIRYHGRYAVQVERDADKLDAIGFVRGKNRQE